MYISYYILLYILLYILFLYHIFISMIVYFEGFDPKRELDLYGMECEPKAS